MADTDPAAILDDGRPLGPRLPDWRPRRPPEQVSLVGRWARLEPLRAGHGDDLFEASVAPGAPERFRYLFEAVPERVELDAWIAAMSPSRDPQFWAVCDAATGRAGGRQALLRTVPEHGVTELGSIMWGPGIARTRIATEALYLTASYVFEELGYRRFEWKCNDRNAPSRRAARRFGFAFEGVFRQAVVIKGVSRDTAWYAMTDGDWARIKPAYQGWLDPDNFEPGGQQRRPLTAREAAAPDVAGDVHTR